MKKKLPDKRRKKFKKKNYPNRLLIYKQFVTCVKDPQKVGNKKKMMRTGGRGAQLIDIVFFFVFLLIEEEDLGGRGLLGGGAWRGRGLRVGGGVGGVVRWGSVTRAVIFLVGQKSRHVGESDVARLAVLLNSGSWPSGS